MCSSIIHFLHVYSIFVLEVTTNPRLILEMGGQTQEKEPANLFIATNSHAKV